MQGHSLSTMIGVCTHFERRDEGWKVEALLPKVAELGIGVIRQEIKWEDVETEKGKYAIPRVDQDWLDQTEAAGFKIILLLCYGNPVYENPLDPDGFAAYAQFMAKTLKRRHIIAYEIWNEPTNFYFYNQYGGSWSGAEPSLWRVKFCELLVKAARAIKAEDPAADIITNPGEPQSIHMMERHPEAFADISGISHHPYSVRFPPETVPFGGGRISAKDQACVADDQHSVLSVYSMTRDHMRTKLGRDLKVYVTEYGFPSYDSHRRGGWFAGYSEHAQAAYSIRSLVMALWAGVESPCLYDLMNDGTDPFDAETNLGLVRHEDEGLKEKPVYFAVQRLMHLLPKGAVALPEAPAVLKVESNPPSEDYFWQRSPAEPFLVIDGPMALWFKWNEENFLTFIWKAGRLNQEEGPQYVDLFWPPGAPDGLSSARIVNLVTGDEKEIPITIPNRNGMNGEAKILANIPLTGDPLIICWQSRRIS